MSVTNSKRIAKTRPKVEYELYGAKGTEKHRRNKTEGTDRVAALRVDAESPEEFVDRAEALATAHGRRIEARSIIQSFESSEFDPNDPEAVQTVNDLGYEFAKKLHPNSDVLVITHVDGAGGVGDDERIAGVSLRLSGVQVGGFSHRQARQVGHTAVGGTGHRDR